MHRAVLIVSVLLAASQVGAQTPGSEAERWAPRRPEMPLLFPYGPLVVRVINTVTHRWCSYEFDLFAVRSGARVGGLRRREPDGAAWRSLG